jgi:hypothetical protein
VSCHARVTWHKIDIVRRDCIRAKVEQRIQRVRTLRERVWTCHEGKKGITDIDADGCYTGGKRGQQRKVSEGVNQDFGHLWEAKELERRPSTRLSA